MAALILGSCSSTHESYRTETDMTGAKVVIGKIDRKLLEHDPDFQWFTNGYARYTVEPGILEALKPRSADLRFVLFLGTWCSDSKAEVPKMFKVFDALSLTPDRIEMYGLDRMKNSDDGAAQRYGVTLVPTLIVYAGQKEIGRIVEQPRNGVEYDINQMILAAH